MKKLFVILAVLAAYAVTAETKQNVLNRLHNTVVGKVAVLDGLAMPEILEIFATASGNKVNFVYLPHINTNSATNAPPPPPPAVFTPVDPTTGLPFIPASPRVGQNFPSPELHFPPKIPLPPFDVEPAEPVMPKIRGIKIKLRNVTLKQLLDITTLSFDKPVRYIITDFGVVFVPRKENKPLLFNRVYRINPRRLNK